MPVHQNSLSEVRKEIDAAHSRFLPGVRRDMQQPESRHRMAIVRALQDHQKYSGPMSQQVWTRIEEWLQGEPLLLPVAGELREAFEACDWESREEGMLELKTVTHRLCKHHIREWGDASVGTDLYRQSQEHLTSMELPVPVISKPEDVLNSGFQTPIGFNYNLFLLDMQLCEREFGKNNVTVQKMRALMENNLRFAQVMGSCRKDIFMSFHRSVALPASTPANADPRMHALYNPECFELAGNGDDGTLEALPKKKIVQSLSGTMPGLERQGCAAMGEAFNGMFDFQRRAFDRYFVEQNLERFVHMSSGQSRR